MEPSASNRSTIDPTVQRLCGVIESAFAGVTLGKGVGLLEAQAIDDYADAETRAAARAKDEKDDWRRIPVDELNRCNSSPSFFDAEGMRFHLPAFLIAELRGEYGFDFNFHLIYISDYVITKFEFLTAEQRRAVKEYLEFRALDPECESDLPHIRHAIETFWTDAPHDPESIA